MWCILPIFGIRSASFEFYSLVKCFNLNESCPCKPLNQCLSKRVGAFRVRHLPCRIWFSFLPWIPGWHSGCLCGVWVHEITEPPVWICFSQRVVHESKRSRSKGNPNNHKEETRDLYIVRGGPSLQFGFASTVLLPSPWLYKWRWWFDSDFKARIWRCVPKLFGTIVETGHLMLAVLGVGFARRLYDIIFSSYRIVAWAWHPKKVFKTKMEHFSQNTNWLATAKVLQPRHAAFRSVG